MGQQLTLFNPDTALSEDDKINQALGFAVERNSIPFLKINKKPESDKGPLPVGQFYLDKEPIAYSKTLNMRIMWRGYQYVNWSTEQEKVVDSTIIAPNFGAEFISQSGKINCGRLTRAKVEEIGEGNLPQEQLALQKAVKLKTMYFGLVSFEGKTQAGEVKQVDNVLCLWSPGFKSASIIDDNIKAIVKEKKALVKTNLAITTKLDQTGANYYYVPVITVSDDVIALTPQDTVALKEIADYVKNINNYIIGQYEKSLKPEHKTLTASDTKDLNDEIPF